MMPPKKALAARQEEAAKSESVETNSLPPVVENDKVESKDGEQNEVDKKKEEDTKEPVMKEKKLMYDPSDAIVEGKRQRFLPVGEQKMNDWLTEHLEEREETRLVAGDVYDAYLESCSSAAIPVMEQHLFSRAVKSMFTKGYGIKEASPYKTVLREKKVVKKKPKIQGETFKLKMRDIIETAIRDLGNPQKGLRFNTLKQHLNLRYPALRLDVRPDFLKKALQRGVYYGHYILIKGVGACGFYGLPLQPGEEVTEENDVKKEKKGEDKETTKENEVDTTENGENSSEKKEDEEDKKKDDAASEKEKTEGKENEKVEETTEVPKARGAKRKAATKISHGGKKAKPKKNKKAQPKKVYRNYILHGDPQRIEDCFHMAMTYMSEPKRASVLRIRKYIEDHYREVNHEKFKKTIATGEEKGFWEQVTGAGAGLGSYKLLIDEFDPTDDNDLIGMTVNAIMACNEPKECSALLLKRYVTEYHTQFKIAEKPFLFKKALERSEAKGVLRRVTGIGSTGSFQLAEVFVPTPAMLAGVDKESDYEDDDTASESSIEDQQVDLSYFQDAYKPRPSKKRGHTRMSATKTINKFDASAYVTKKKMSSKKKLSLIYKKKNLEKKNLGKKTPGKKTQAKGKRKKGGSEESAEESESEESESDADDYEEVYRPTTTKSRGGGRIIASSKHNQPMVLTKAAKKQPMTKAPVTKKQAAKKNKKPAKKANSERKSPKNNKADKKGKAAAKKTETNKKSTPVTKGKGKKKKGKK